MKRRLNILCLLVFLVFCYSVFNMGRDFGHGFSEGMKISHSGNQSVEQAINFRIATLMPKDFPLKILSIMKRPALMSPLPIHRWLRM